MTRVQMKKNRPRKKRRKEKPSRTAKKGQQSILGMVLPVAGDKTVAGEAFAELNVQEKELVAEKINRKTKKVLYMLHNVTITLIHVFTLRLRKNQRNKLFAMWVTQQM